MPGLATIGIGGLPDERTTIGHCLGHMVSGVCRGVGRNMDRLTTTGGASHERQSQRGVELDGDGQRTDGPCSWPSALRRQHIVWGKSGADDVNLQRSHPHGTLAAPLWT